jgi:hypothetical protein
MNPEHTEVSMTLTQFVVMMVALAGFGTSLLRYAWRISSELHEIKTAIAKISYESWTVRDQMQWAMTMQRENGASIKVPMPEPKSPVIVTPP